MMEMSRLLDDGYGVATISRLFKIIGLFFRTQVSFVELFCKRDSWMMANITSCVRWLWGGYDWQAP